ncbi:MarR family winged helix-turn-helix transcriptional regulator [Parasphingorhabdus litoris]|uniref:MarR family winged helix-turn-helix transcriptional regulator n=1 Tax=Parasphingorhabdus litoris TaxID=394733 RepID=A0ABN1ALI0_9SPHN|nr:MarR family winged helix-turn-helix transcriptional regulator [Parasphingorhabdus litoris]
MKQPKIFYLLQKAHSALFRASDKILKQQIGLTASQQAVLFILTKGDGQPISAIAEQLKMGKSSLTGLVDRMEARQLVTRQKSASDARSVEVFITPTGTALVEASLSGTKRVNAALLEPFSSDERATIERFLKHVAEQADSIVQTHAKHEIPERNDL